MPKLVVKPGVQPRLINILVAVANAAQGLSVSEVVITAGIDGTHSQNSLHYALRALDVRSKNFPTNHAKEAFASTLRAELGKDYQVLLEDLGGPNEHFHIQFRPS